MTPAQVAVRGTRRGPATSSHMAKHRQGAHSNLGLQVARVQRLAVNIREGPCLQAPKGEGASRVCSRAPGLGLALRKEQWGQGAKVLHTRRRSAMYRRKWQCPREELGGPQRGVAGRVHHHTTSTGCREEQPKPANTAWLADTLGYRTKTSPGSSISGLMIDCSDMGVLLAQLAVRN
jgi:hypothetical protein